MMRFPIELICNEQNASKQTFIQKFHDGNLHFRIWTDFLRHNELIARYRDIMLVRSFKYCTFANINYDLQKDYKDKNKQISRHCKGG